MLTRMFLLQSAFVAVAAMGLLVGCTQNGQDEQTTANGETSQPTESSGEVHDLHDVPLTEQEIAQLKAETARYEDAVDRIQQYQQTIQQEATGGEPAHAHRALDNLDIVLERLPEAARDSGVPKVKWQEVNETAQKLRDLFNQVHANIDAGKAPNYEAVADEIEQGVQTLAAIEPEKTESEKTE